VYVRVCVVKQDQQHTHTLYIHIVCCVCVCFFIILVHTHTHTHSDGLSGAVSGAQIEDVIGQIDTLTKKINSQAFGSGSLMKQWKVLTMLIGANNVCGCTAASNQPDQWEKKVRGVV
jgi:preprotein translocase subunit SecG